MQSNYIRESHRLPGVETVIIIIGVHVHRVFLVLGLVVLYSISPAERHHNCMVWNYMHCPNGGAGHLCSHRR